MLDYPELVTAVEWATVIVTFIMMGSGFPVCLHMYKHKSTTNVPYLLFLISAFVSTMSLQYGMLVKNKILILINVIAILVWGAYVSIYILVSRSKAVPVLKLLAVVALYLSHSLYLKTVPESEVMPTLGYYLIVWCTLLYLIPAGDIITMVQQKSTHCCDLPLLFGGTLSAGVWYLYGILVDDINIYFPSIPALFVSAVKFLMMFIYGFPSKKTPATIAAKHFHGHDGEFHEDVYKVNSRETLRQRK